MDTSVTTLAVRVVRAGDDGVTVAYRIGEGQEREITLRVGDILRFSAETPAATPLIPEAVETRRIPPDPRD